jgi:hypothetical protein
LVKVETNSSIAPAAASARARRRGPGKIAESWMAEPGTLNGDDQTVDLSQTEGVLHRSHGEIRLNPADFRQNAGGSLPAFRDDMG